MTIANSNPSSEELAGLGHVALRQVSKVYRQGDATITVLDKADLDIARGECVVITGRSGVGKTTLLSLVGGLTLPSAGSIQINGTNLAEMDETRRSDFRAREIGFVFQFNSLLPTLTALENVLMGGMFTQAKPDPRRGLELLEMVGLKEKVNSYPAQLSGGQQRRVAIARALINRPALLLADEPTGDLDVDTEAEILHLLRQVHTQGTTIVLVTHNPQLNGFGRRQIKMERGRLIEQAANAAASAVQLTSPQ